ncbi:MAG: hypothetical protein A2665_00560 [Candidatus Zambryskibacteria bacterium RIFCSPHIGHO2_01_FULL_46_30]|uniref:DUF5667 domain-containing protein n=1 Tax=Candidatus Zambryskibacteria bacterium RIFCSPHIGHO2_01_FULL_46_30 TaxID=1802739 RepID=A0A1G2T6W2_9BACT|nr:MAG: hypothetical protein A2665_00560 [Candidatus Zambryskibacteria bacterium RIFCSPHIGHO2_01_FULL_46_30]OHB06454.1 MAG: hypothetical protein A3B22_01830 [Candidatus Zambryskibacteria bacterium RIFCSPLOWO2_01_FULL_47_33]
MAKQYLSTLLFLALVFGAFSSVSAQEASLNTSVNTEAIQVQAQMRAEIEARRAQADERREAARIEAEARRAEAQSKRVEFQQAVAKRQVENTARVILATIERLENIIVRLESRMAKIKAQGGVTSESETFVAAARANLSDARLAVDAFVSIDLSSERALENFQRIRATAAETREHIRAAHRNLMMAVRSLSSVEMNLEAGISAE